MEKILSICLPSYNMEAYLDRSVGSLIVPEVLDRLEIIIVNDGSKDKTLEIANSYKEKYPESVVVIDKPNGHYGSCINAALKIATGKYFRILDADDWFDSNNLAIMVKELEQRDEDAIFTKFTLQNERLGKAIEQDVNGIVYNKPLYLNEYKIPEPCLAMHNYTFKLDHLKSINYVQTEGICYTDTEYVYFPLCSAKTLYCFDMSLYQYYIGRNEQTMAIGPLVKNYSHFEKVLYKLWSTEVTSPNANYQMIRTHYDILLIQYLFQINCIYSERDNNREKKLKEIMRELSNSNSLAYNTLLNANYHGVKYIQRCIRNGKIDRVILSLTHLVFKLKNH